jgi:methyl-accepting chemotaxis protein
MFAAPIFVNNKVEGVLIGRRDGAVLADMTRNIGLGETGYVYMINAKGTIICHPDTNMVYEQVAPVEAAKSDRSLRSLALFFEDVLNRRSDVTEYTFKGRVSIAAYAEVPDTDWILIGTVAKDEFVREIKQMLIKTLVICAGAAIVAVFILLSLLSFILIRPIKGIVSAAIALAELKFDILIPRDRKDEIGDVQRAFHTIRDELKKTITDIHNEHMGQKNVSGNLHLSIRESSDGLAVISRSMDSVQNKTNTQMESVVQTADSVEGIIGHIRSLDNAVEVQADTISLSSK